MRLPKMSCNDPIVGKTAPYTAQPAFPQPKTAVQAIKNRKATRHLPQCAPFDGVFSSGDAHPVSTVDEPQQLTQEATAGADTQTSLAQGTAVEWVEQITLQQAVTYGEAVARLLEAVESAAVQHAGAPSGVLRLECPLPRGPTSLQWLQGQHSNASNSTTGSSRPCSSTNGSSDTASIASSETNMPYSNGHQPAARPISSTISVTDSRSTSSTTSANSSSTALLFPSLYFSPRRSPAPATPGSLAAQGGARGSEAVAAAGAAVLWKGAPGTELSEAKIGQMSRYLSSDCPRIRLLGGARFAQRQIPSQEWAAFGSFLFFLPLVDYSEAAGCNLLSVTLAWDAQAAADEDALVVASAVSQAAAAAAGALRALQPPAKPAAPAFNVYPLPPSPPSPDGQTHDTTACPSTSTTTANVAGAPKGTQGPLQGAPQQGPSAHSAKGVNGNSTGSNGLAVVQQDMPQRAQQANGMLAQHMEHLPSKSAWQDAMQAVLDELPPENDENVDGQTDGQSENGADNQRELGRNGSGLQVTGDVSAGMLEEWLRGGQGSLDDLLGVLDGGTQEWGDAANESSELSKVVMARRSTLRVQGQLDPLQLLQALQAVRDPRAYQFALMPQPGVCFFGSSPEQLFSRNGHAVASEAVAATRPRAPPGDVQGDFWLGLDLLRCSKDHREFTLVRDWVRDSLKQVCSQVIVEREKSILKQGVVQHLYGKLAATLKEGMTDGHLLAALHPTPAVCGRPREKALELLMQTETFDRGLYAGPLGWISGSAAEFIVAIRSALHEQGTGSDSSHTCANSISNAYSRSNDSVSTCDSSVDSAYSGSADGSSNAYSGVSNSTSSMGKGTETVSDRLALGGSVSQLSVYAGVGIVRGSDAAQEWAELDVKASQCLRLLRPLPALRDCPNVNLLWARLMVEEACRNGVNVFAVAPGSRSSPLAAAIAAHPAAIVVAGIDERSLGFWAVGYGKATGKPAAVICSSGTAVANLLPAVVEASQSDTTLILLTADRPLELLDAGANQTIDQVKIFGDYTRWTADLDAPGNAVPARVALTTIDTAIRSAEGGPEGPFGAPGGRPGPVHVNCRFRDPLIPVDGDWDRRLLQGLESWEISGQPYTSPLSLSLGPYTLSGPLTGPSAGFQLPGPLIELLRGAQRGLLVLGHLPKAADVAAAVAIARQLGWPVVTDVLSDVSHNVPFLDHFDQLLLLEHAHWPDLAPDVCLCLGSHPTSKRLGQFLEFCVLKSQQQEQGAPGTLQGPRRGPTRVVHVGPTWQRHDPSHVLSMQLQAPLPHLAQALTSQQLQIVQYTDGNAYRQLLMDLDAAAKDLIRSELSQPTELSEPAVAYYLSQHLPLGDALFLGNSMPIRDMDMFAQRRNAAAQEYVFDDAQYMDTTPLDEQYDLDVDGPGALLRGPSPPGGPEGPQGPASHQAWVLGAPGAPVGSNRGASGIDGVLSSAAGFAVGTGRATTLVIGDISFLHDTNGLALLRDSETRPPVTVVLINNSGGGIFNFLPVAGAVPQDAFTQLWSTPQNVDVASLCRAHGLPHTRVSSMSELPSALRNAWSLNGHSIVEVVTDRQRNVEQHRQLQADVKGAVRKALDNFKRYSQSTSNGHSSVAASAAADAAASSTNMPENGDDVIIEGLDYHRYQLPLTQPLTTNSQGDNMRQGLLLRLHVRHAAQGSSQADAVEGAKETLVYTGLGDCAPLPGLHTESLEQAELQIRCLQALLAGKTLTHDVLHLNGAMRLWLTGQVGINAGTLCPSVLFALESSIFGAFAELHNATPAHLLSQHAPTCLVAAVPQGAPAGPSQGPLGALRALSVAVNALIGACDSVEEAVAKARELVVEGYTSIKVKLSMALWAVGQPTNMVVQVGRQPDVQQDIAMLSAIRNAVGPNVTLRADANRAWDSQQAIRFIEGLAACPEIALEYVEEPVGPRTSWRALQGALRSAGTPIGLDESLDEACGPNGFDASQLPEDLPLDLVGAAVVKPAVVGGWEATARVCRWAAENGIKVVISSAFESSVGLCALTQLAAWTDRQTDSLVSHGLGTGSWFASDILPDTAFTSLMQTTAATTAETVAEIAATGKVQSGGGAGVRISIDAAWQLDRSIVQALADSAVLPNVSAGQQSCYQQLQRSTLVVQQEGATYNFSVLHTAGAPVGPTGLPAGPTKGPLMVFLHGFLGDATDWAPFMHTLGGLPEGVESMAVDLPGHGKTSVTSTQNLTESSSQAAQQNAEMPVDRALSVEATADAVAQLVSTVVQSNMGPQGPSEGPLTGPGSGQIKVVLVGYSMGARVAAALVAQHPGVVNKLVLVSGALGLEDEAARTARAAADDALAARLQEIRLPAFVREWYTAGGALWGPLRAHSNFPLLLEHRATAENAEQVAQLAMVLRAMSPGRMDRLTDINTLTWPPSLYVAGELDAKYATMGNTVKQLVEGGSEGEIAEGDKRGSVGKKRGYVDVRLVQNAGHAVHIERPVELLSLLYTFLRA